MSKAGRQPRRRRADYASGLPDYHDPTAGFGGAAPAQSALTLRAWLAGFGVVVCIVGAGLAVYLGVAWFAWVMASPRWWQRSIWRGCCAARRAANRGDPMASRTRRRSDVTGQPPSKGHQH